MKLADIIQMQKDRSNGVVLSQISIDKLIGHALMREIEAERLTQALADSNLALMEQTKLADKCRKQAETLEAERDQARAELEEWRFTNKIDELQREVDRHRAAPQQHAQAALSADQIEELMPENEGNNGAFPCDKCGWIQVSAQWLHDFANNVHRATRQPAPVASAPAVAVPEGWQLVPIIPTGVMKDAGAFALPIDYSSPAAAGNAYRAMLSLAPQPAAAPVAAAVPPRRFNWTQQGMEQAADGAYCYASAAAQGDAHAAAQDDHLGHQAGDEREAFESVVGKLGKWLYTRNGDGTYQEIAMQGFWSIWQAALAQRAARQPDSERDAARIEFHLEQDTSWHAGHGKNGAGILCYGPKRKEVQAVTWREAIDAAMATKQGDKP